MLSLNNSYNLMKKSMHTMLQLGLYVKHFFLLPLVNGNYFHLHSFEYGIVQDGFGN